MLSSSQDEAQGIAQTIHAHVDLGAEPAAAPSQGLGCLAALLGALPQRRGGPSSRDRSAAFWAGAPAAQGWAPRRWVSFPASSGRSRSAGVGPDHRAVDDKVFHIRVVGQMLMQEFPDTPVAPAGESFVDAVPVPIPGWKKSPLGAGAVDPQSLPPATTGGRLL